ncbi:TVP38/TMEM64 family protein [Corynebacterium lipophiloflavum]|uniref:TVP38/TMEM64 family membrane protein n=1 Tax=Corynebacterium lipophiloflavum (strain ATCC 700352 / DSM 44291 / CCUG 37336 / JCM 10383 / DMMZ 1944) TaxID=525263 RepID=C0XT10_CORLD|nr:TVP38/TMEM64 family protein [Corynebacterium lipophiloflavum]EEI16625.1 SNARE-like domain protein [Corynebacterium lipophiloflavum DSM 44291]
MSRSRIALVAVAAALFATAWVLLDVPSLAVLRTWADQTGAWFPILFWVLYVVVTQLPIPRTVMTISAGVLFGTLWGIVIALSATTVAAAISLLIVRFLLRDFVEARLNHPAIKSINLWLEQRGWLAIASLRLIAVVPFSILNYAAALSRVPVGAFTLATLVGSATNTVIVAVFGDALTGEANTVVLIIMAVLAVVGTAGLLLDATLPTRRVNALD